ALLLPTLIWRTCHSMSGLTIERWKRTPLIQAKRRRPDGVVPIARSVPFRSAPAQPALCVGDPKAAASPPHSEGAAGPDVRRFQYRSTVPCQSTHSISMLFAYSP